MPMIDQQLITSGHDIEILLGERYMQYLLLLGLDTGVIPVETTFGDPPVTARLSVPPALDRTYEPDPDAPQPHFTSRSDAFGVEVLVGHPSGADLRVTLRILLSRGSQEVETDLGLFVRLGLATGHDPDGSLASAALSIELLDVDGGLIALAASQTPPISKGQVLSAVKAQVERQLDLTGLGSGGRVEDIALRKHAPADGVPAAFGLYLNLRLKTGPHPDQFLPRRGDVLQAQNALFEGTDLVFATRRDLYGHLGKDAFHRRAEPNGRGGFSYPLRRRPSDPASEKLGTLKGISMAPYEGSETDTRLRIKVHGEIDFSVIDPDFELIIDLFPEEDEEGVLKWGSGMTVEAGLFAHIVLGAAAVALAPLTGGWSLAVWAGVEIAAGIIIEEIVEDRAQAKVDAAMLDISPTRLTILRRRWDPFYTTHHQLGLRKGGFVANEHGLALWGNAVLTKTPALVGDVVIREAERDEDGLATALRYRVDLDPAHPDLTAKTLAADRAAFVQHNPVGDPTLFQLGVDDAVARVGEKRLLGKHPYLVERVEMDEDAQYETIKSLLCISERESKEQSGRLEAEYAEAARARITAESEADIRTQVLAEFDAAGVIPTPEQVDARVAEELEKLIAADVKSYVDGPLAADLDAALLPLLRFELSPSGFGRLQHHDLLFLKDYIHVRVVEDDSFHYRDHYDPATETTPEEREADNLGSRPRYRSTPQGPVFS
jgi:hypothetical protein